MNDAPDAATKQRPRIAQCLETSASWRFTLLGRRFSIRRRYMNGINIIDSLQVILRETADEQLQIASADNLFALGLLDSVRLIELVARLEKQFGIAVQDREMVPDNFLSLERINLYLQRKLGGEPC
jgi:acyl carrier protein